jgi:hypothetical protein
LSKELAERNIIVSSWGDYKINLGEDAASDVAVGYNEEDLFMYAKGSTELITESFGSFKSEHESDLCHRLALRTHGSVFNLNEVRKPFVLQKIPEWFQESREQHSFSIKSCEIVHNNKYADFADFKFSKVFHHEIEDGDDFDDASDAGRRIKMGA